MIDAAVTQVKNCRFVDETIDKSPYVMTQDYLDWVIKVKLLVCDSPVGVITTSDQMLCVCCAPNPTIAAGYTLFTTLAVC